MDQQGTFERASIWATLGLAAFTLRMLAGCEQTTPPRLDDQSRTATAPARLDQIQDLGSGVYVFPNNENFPETLADFRKSHSDLKIISVTPGPDKTYGILDQAYARSDSYIIVTEPAPR